MDQKQFQALIEVMNQNTQLLIAQFLSKEKSNSTEDNADSPSKVPIINIAHIPPFESFDQKKRKFYMLSTTLRELFNDERYI